MVPEDWMILFFEVTKDALMLLALTMCLSTYSKQTMAVSEVLL